MTATVELRTVPPPPRRLVVRAAAPAWVGTVVWGTTVVGVLATWLVAYALGLGTLQERHAQHVLFTRFRQQIAQQVAPPHLGADGRVAAVAAGAPVALLTSDRLHLRNAVVVQGTRGGDLRNGPGHLPGSVLPGENGTSWIIGKGTTYGAPFARLTSLRAGDQLTVTSQEGVFIYVVNDVRTSGDPIPSTPSPARLTLATSVGSGWHGGWAPTRVVYVDAVLHGNPRGVVAVPQAVTRGDGVGRGDAAALVPLFLWLLALVGAVLCIVWARVRWGAWQAWVAGAPVVVATLWGGSDCVLQLLPNVF